MLWAWERPERLTFLDPREAGVAFLARSVNWRDGRIDSPNQSGLFGSVLLSAQLGDEQGQRMKGLAKINQTLAAEFWSEYAAGKFKHYKP